MARDMPVQDLWQAHRDHLSDEQGHIVDPLCDNHQVAFSKDLLGLLRQLHSHGTLLPPATSALERAYQLHVMGSKDRRLQAQAPPEIQLLDFLYSEWGGYSIFTRLLRLLYDFPPPVCHTPQRQGGRRLSSQT